MNLKVAMISFHEWGGHPAYVREVTSAIQRCSVTGGVSVVLVTSVALDPQFRKVAYDVYPVLPPYPHKSMSSPAYKLRQFLHPLRVDAACIAWLADHPEIRGVHFQDYHSLGSAFQINRYIAARRLLIFTVHNIRPHRYFPFCRALMDGMARYTWRRCNALFVHTEKLRAELATFLGEPHPPIYVTPHGAFEPTRLRKGQSLKRRLECKKLLFFGAVRQNKGLHTVLDAMENLQEFSLTIAGGGYTERGYWHDSILPRIRRLQSQGRKIAILHEYIEEASLHELWNSHSAIVLPYTAEFKAQSGVLFLAVGLETPIIASDSGGLQETLAEHRIGEIMPSNTATGLVQALRNLYSRPVDELERGFESAKRDLSWDRNARRAMEAYIATDHLYGYR